MISPSTKHYISAIQHLIPLPSHASRKGDYGKIGILGGSIEYTGAPYFAAISALRTGADLCHVICAEEAAIPIKSYSPDLIVHPLLPSDRSMNYTPIINDVFDVVRRLDVLVIGPGLGRDNCIRSILKELLPFLQKHSVPVIFDGDALFFLSKDLTLIKDLKQIYLTPNAMEYARLCEATKLIKEADPDIAKDVEPKELAQRLGNAIIVRKGKSDVISDGLTTLVSDDTCTFKRSGGQGDILAGCTATFIAWATRKDCSQQRTDEDPSPLLLAAFAGSVLTRASSFEAQKVKGLAMTATDVLDHIGNVFSTVFGERLSSDAERN